MEVKKPLTPAPGSDNSIESRLHRIVGRLTAIDAASRESVLTELDRVLSDGPAEQAAAALQHFLDSQADAILGRAFKVGARGTLKEAPTLRTHLLDLLGQIDPTAAAAYAKVIFESSPSPDEWAVALRNLAAGDSTIQGRATLLERTAELLRREAWQQNPSIGYLEAFDAAVYLGVTNLVPALADLVRKPDNPAVAHAAYLALDRLVFNHPVEMLTALASQPELMRGRELTRADYFARADVRDASQRQVLESYLLDSRISPRELAQFAGVYPNANFMISDNLLTTSSALDAANLRARDEESLKTVTSWLADPRFDRIRPRLQQIQFRLEEFVRQSNAR